MDQKIIDLYDEFTHGDMSRAGFLSRLVGLVGGVPAAAAVLTRLENDYGRRILPTNPVLIGAITMGGVSWERWARWVLPLQALLYLLGALALVPAVLGGWTA